MGGWSGSLGKGPQEQVWQCGYCGVPGNWMSRQNCRQCGGPSPMWGTAKGWQQMGSGKNGKGNGDNMPQKGTGTQITRERRINGTMVPLEQWQS
eukprot:5133491-Heterocapsa_arctica.AAC.1